MDFQRSIHSIKLNRMKRNLPTARLVPALASAVAIALMTLATVAAAQIYECTDAKGAKEYAQSCPPGTVKQRQVVEGGSAGAPAAGPKTIDQQEIEFRKRLLERQEAEAKEAQERAKAEEAERNCTAVRSTLKALQEGQRMSRMDPDSGEIIRFGDEERAAETERQLKQFEVWCKK